MPYVQYQISSDKLKFVVFDLDKNEYSEYINEVKNLDTIRVSDRCYEIQYSKFSWFKNEDKSYDYYFWFDSGLSHTGIIPNKYLSSEGYRGYFESSLFNSKFLDNLIEYIGDKFLFVAKENSRNFWEGTVDSKYYTNYDNSVHIIGGFFGGKKELWDDVVNTFDKYVRQVLPEQNRLFYEEHFMSFIQTHLEEGKINAFVETLANYDEFSAFVDLWLEEEKEETYLICISLLSNFPI